MCINIYIYVYIYIYIYIYMYYYLPIARGARPERRLRRAWACTCTYLYIYIYIYTHTYIHIHTYPDCEISPTLWAREIPHVYIRLKRAASYFPRAPEYGARRRRTRCSVTGFQAGSGKVRVFCFYKKVPQMPSNAIRFAIFVEMRHDSLV